MPNPRTFLMACITAAACLCGVAAQAQPAAGTYTLPDSLTPLLPGSALYRMGGLSSLFYVGGNEFWAITDRGPNVDSGSTLVFPVPAFQPTIFKIRLAVNGTFTIVESIPTTRTDGGPTSGMPNPAPYSSGEVARDTTMALLPNDDWGFDSEGLLRSPDGTFWFCDEYAPGIAHVGADGRIIARVRPQPAGGLPDILKKRVGNRGFEGIAQTPNGRIYAIVQSGMANSFANTASANSTAGNNTEMLRLVEYDPATGNTRMFAYLIDPGFPASGGSNARRRDIKIGDMQAVNNDELLLIEHALRGATNIKKVYKINISSATPITAEAFQTGPTTFKSLEELTRTEITTIAGITPVAKTLLIDLNNPGAGNTPWPAQLEKPEGLAVLSSTRIAVGNDNDFGVISTNADGRISLTGTPSRVIVYNLATPLAFNQPSQVVLGPVSNAPVCPSATVRFAAAAIGSPAPTVQWQVSTDGGAHFSNVAGATADTLTLSGLTLAMNGNRYQAVYTNSFGASTSGSATLSVVDNAAPVPNTATLPTVTGQCSAAIATRPTATDNCAGTVTGTTSDPLSYSRQGTFVVHWTYNDGNGNTSTQNQTVIVRDTIRPTITVSVSPNSLWPPNHRLHTITATVNAADNCDGVTYVLTSITSNERDNEDCDGDEQDDIQNADFGTNDRTFSLRAERDGDRSGRIYTITYTATDAGGNTATASATVTVPHDQGHGHGKLVITGAGEADAASFASSAAPSPFSGSTTLTFTLPDEAATTVRVFDVNGRQVAVLADAVLGAGAHALQWNGRDGAGHALPAGSYLYVIESNGTSEAGKVVLMR